MAKCNKSTCVLGPGVIGEPKLFMSQIKISDSFPPDATRFGWREEDKVHVRSRPESNCTVNEQTAG